MKILGCFKIVPDFDMLTDCDWVADSNNNIDVSFAKTIWNCFDESALEMMLRLSDLSESFNVIYKLSALTIGTSQCDMYLKTLYALGYNKAVRIDCNRDLRFCPQLISKVIAEYVKCRDLHDIIVMGRQSSDGGNTQTALFTAEILGWPCITEVIEIQPFDEKHIKIQSMTDEGILTQVIKTPCVLSIGNSPNSYLRVPTLKDRMKSSKKQIEALTLEDLNINYDLAVNDGKVELLNLYKVVHDRKGIIITGKSAEEKANKLYLSYLKERLDKL